MRLAVCSPHMPELEANNTFDLDPSSGLPWRVGTFMLPDPLCGEFSVMIAKGDAVPSVIKDEQEGNGVASTDIRLHRRTGEKMKAQFGCLIQ